MLFKKNKKSKCFLGLDITTTTIKILELSQKNQLFHIENFALANINTSNASIESLLQNNSQLITTTVSHLLNTSHINTQNTTVALADHNVMNKIIRFDKSCTIDEIEQQIALDYKNYFAPINEPLNYDFYILGDSKQFKDSIDVWVIAAKQLLVDNCITALGQAGLQINTLDLASLAIARSCRLIPAIINCLENKQLFAILNMTSKQVTIIIYCNNVPLLTRTIILEQQLNKPITEGHDQDILAIPTHQQSFVIQQVQQILHAFYASYQISTVKYLLLSGDISNLVAFSELLNAEFDIPCSVANPFNNMSFSECCDRQTLLRQAHQWMICSGLAMRTSD